MIVNARSRAVAVHVAIGRDQDQRRVDLDGRDRVIEVKMVLHWLMYDVS